MENKELYPEWMVRGWNLAEQNYQNLFAIEVAICEATKKEAEELLKLHAKISSHLRYLIEETSKYKVRDKNGE